jgi:hypothetical protein
MFPLLGGIASGVMSMFGASSTNSANQQLAQQQDAFQEQMSNTAYQRASTDMQAAGLNPAAMFGSGSAASTPSGATIAMQNPMAGAAQNIQQGISSAYTAKVQDATVNNLAQTTANAVAQNAVIKAMPDLIKGQTAQSIAGSWKTTADAKNADIDTAVHEALASKATTDKGFYDSGIGQTLRTLGTGAEETGRFFSPLSSILNSAKSLAP